MKFPLALYEETFGLNHFKEQFHILLKLNLRSVDIVTIKHFTLHDNFELDANFPPDVRTEVVT